MCTDNTVTQRSMTILGANTWLTVLAHTMARTAKHGKARASGVSHTHLFVATDQHLLKGARSHTDYHTVDCIAYTPAPSVRLCPLNTLRRGLQLS